MKKTVIALCLAVSVLAVVFWSMGKSPVLEHPIQMPQSDSFLTAEAIVTQDLRTVKGDVHFKAENQTGETLSEIVLRGYANGEIPGTLVVSGASFNGQASDVKQDENDPTVYRIPCVWRSGETAEISWHFALTVPRNAGALSRDEDSALLVGAIPVPAMWEDGTWNTQAWDALAEPSYARTFDVTFSLTLPEDVQAAMGGVLTGIKDNEDGKRTWTAQMNGARDLSFALRRGGVFRQKETENVLITVLDADRGRAGKLLRSAEKAVKVLKELGFTPGDALTIVQADTGKMDGMIGSGLIVLAGDAEGEALDRQMIRLAARQIFGVQIENNPWQEPWLSQSLAAAVEMLCYRREKGNEAYEKRYYEDIEVATRLTRPHGVNVGAAVLAFRDDQEMTQVLRDQGAAALLGIEQATGEEAFVRALVRYVRSADTGSFDALARALEAETGSDWSGYLADMLAS